jgi:hypothetical protein
VAFTFDVSSHYPEGGGAQTGSGALPRVHLCLADAAVRASRAAGAAARAAESRQRRRAAGSRLVLSADAAAAKEATERLPASHFMGGGEGGSTPDGRPTCLACSSCVSAVFRTSRCHSHALAKVVTCTNHLTRPALHYLHPVRSHPGIVPDLTCIALATVAPSALTRRSGMNE